VDLARKAYTLFELVLVLAIVVVLSAMVYPSMDAMLNGDKPRQAADAVRAAWAIARAHAMDDGRPYRFSVVPGKSNYRIEPDTPDSSVNAGDPVAPGFTFEEAIPKGIRFSTMADAQSGAQDMNNDTVLPPGSVDPGAYVPTVFFLPDGTSHGTDGEDVEVVFQARGVRPVVLRIRGLTGVVTTRTLDSKGGRP
jgi:prepilin-type N-terminal cleavage/methylation domain-containing protein